MSLITTIAELKKYILVEDNAKIKSLAPFIDQAELLYMKALLSKEFYEEIEPLYQNSISQNPTALSADIDKLLPYIQRSLAYYTQLLAIDQLSVTFGELGVRTHRGDDSDPAPQRQIEKLQVQALKNGDLHADLLLAFLEENATDTNDYATWFKSTANSKATGLIVRSTSIAMKHIQISDSRRIFLKLLPKIKEIEQRHISKLIGPDQYSTLVDHIINDNVTNKEKALIDLLEPIICKKALYLTLPFLSVSIQADGLWLFSDVNQLRDRWFLADDDAEDDYRCHLKDDEFGYPADEMRLRAFVLDNIDDYPLIKASGIYMVQPTPGPTFQPSNNPFNKHFIV